MPRIYIDENLQYSPQDMNRRENTLGAARLMVNAALTAPMGGGVPQVEAEIVYGQEEQEALAREMEKLAYEKGKKFLERIFLTESVMARQADVIVFLGNYRASDDPFDVNCGGCSGQPSCGFLYERKKLTAHLIDLTDRRTDRFINGPLCTVRVTDLGFAMGSALQMANRLMVDARPFFTMGLAGQRLGYYRHPRGHPVQESLCGRLSGLSHDGQREDPDQRPPVSHVHATDRPGLPYLGSETGRPGGGGPHQDLHGLDGCDAGEVPQVQGTQQIL
jgi:uncharacterized ferredoxin-like protein